MSGNKSHVHWLLSAIGSPGESWPSDARSPGNMLSQDITLLTTLLPPIIGKTEHSIRAFVIVSLNSASEMALASGFQSSLAGLTKCYEFRINDADDGFGSWANKLKSKGECFARSASTVIVKYL